MNKRTRLFNFLIDSLLFFMLSVVFSLLLKDYLEQNELKYVMILLYYLYYFIFEFTFRQTVGKMITKSKVVNVENGEKPNFSRILLRTLSRLIPIDFLSYLFSPNGIHDRLSKTELKHVKT